MGKIMPTQIRYEVYDPTDSRHVECGDLLAVFQQAQAELDRESGNEETMLPLDPSVLAQHPLGIFAFETDGVGTPDTLRAYNAVRAEYTEDRTIEIGGLIVSTAEEHRSKGWAYAVKPELYRHIRERWFGWKVLVFANQVSKKMNRGMGFTDVTEIPAGAYEYCVSSCRKFSELGQGVLCCDQENIIGITADDQSLNYATEVAIRKMTEKGRL